jgi:hypothetical protein
MVGMEDSAVQAAAGLGGHPQGVRHRAGAYAACDGPAEDPAAEAVQNGREVEELSAHEREIRDVAHVFAPGPGIREVPLEQVGDQRGGRVRDGGAHAPTQTDARDGERPHHPGDPLLVHPPPFLAELGRYSREAVGAARLAVDLADLLGQDPVPVLLAGEPLAGRTC